MSWSSPDSPAECPFAPALTTGGSRLSKVLDGYIAAIPCPQTPYKATGEVNVTLSKYGAVPLSRETGFSPWEVGRDTTGVLRDSRYGL